MKGADKSVWCWACKLLSKQWRMVVRGGIKWGEVVRPMVVASANCGQNLNGIILSAGMEYWWCSQHVYKIFSSPHRIVICLSTDVTSYLDKSFNTCCINIFKACGDFIYLFQNGDISYKNNANNCYLLRTSRQTNVFDIYIYIQYVIKLSLKWYTLLYSWQIHYWLSSGPTVATTIYATCPLFCSENVVALNKWNYIQNTGVVSNNQRGVGVWDTCV